MYLTNEYCSLSHIIFFMYMPSPAVGAFVFTVATLVSFNDMRRYCDLFVSPLTANALCFLHMASNKSVRAKDWHAASQAFERMHTHVSERRQDTVLVVPCLTVTNAL